MPSMVNLGMVSMNTPQQNSSLFIGESIMTGMDANVKFDSGLSSTFGSLIYQVFSVNTNFDNFQGASGVMNDQDVKSNLSGNL